jgi:hypothetical protein
MATTLIERGMLRNLLPEIELDSPDKVTSDEWDPETEGIPCVGKDYCGKTGALPEMAADWYEEGGWTRQVVQDIYDQLARDYCEGPCQEARDPSLPCELSSAVIAEKLIEVDGDWQMALAYEWVCCCRSDVQRPGPTPPRDGPFVPDDDDGVPDDGEDL